MIVSFLEENNFSARAIENLGVKYLPCLLSALCARLLCCEKSLLFIAYRFVMFHVRRLLVGLFLGNCVAQNDLRTPWTVQPHLCLEAKLRSKICLGLGGKLSPQRHKSLKLFPSVSYSAEVIEKLLRTIHLIKEISSAHHDSTMQYASFLQQQAIEVSHRHARNTWNVLALQAA